MLHTVRHPIAAILGSLLAGCLAAQQVVISEIRADGAERWVEINNRGTNSVSLGTWSLHYATRTVGYPQNYWWGFPSWATLEAGGFLRVHWFQNSPGTTVPGELYTGTSPYGFLFGLGGETLRADGAAFAIVHSQLNGEMNTATMYDDWVSWGTHGFTREALAVQNGRWTSNCHLPAIPAGQSLARNPAAIGNVATHDLQWFVDPTPTPMGENVSGVVVASYGQGCAVPGHHLLGVPTLRATSLPMVGNPMFGYSVDCTTGIYGECMLFVFSAAAAPSGLPSLLPAFPGASCAEAIDTNSVLAVSLLHTQAMQTDLPLSLANVSPALSGMAVHAQAMLFDWLPNAYPPFQGLTNAVMVVIGQ